MYMATYTVLIIQALSTIQSLNSHTQLTAEHGTPLSHVHLHTVYMYNASMLIKKYQIAVTAHHH